MGVRFRPADRRLTALTFLFALLFAGSAEALVGHHHDDITGGRQCAVCQVVNTAADAPRTASPAPTLLLEAPGEPVLTLHAGPAFTFPTITRLRAPPAV